jgi:hypothetical protein
MLYQNGNEIIGLGGVNVCRSQAFRQWQILIKAYVMNKIDILLTMP